MRVLPCSYDISGMYLFTFDSYDVIPKMLLTTIQNRNIFWVANLIIYNAEQRKKSFIGLILFNFFIVYTFVST